MQAQQPRFFVYLFIILLSTISQRAVGSISGGVAAWGINGSGQTSLQTNLIDAVAVDAGYEHTIALRADGTVVAWGSNAAGQTVVPGGVTNGVQVSAGYRHSVVLLSDGQVIAWGDNSWRQSTVPVSVTNVLQVSAGGFHNVALLTNGTVVGWGNNVFGQTIAPSVATNVIAVQAGAFHTVALRADRTVLAWGYNGDGQCDVPASATNVISIASGFNHTVALRQDGTVIAWGYNGNGQTNVAANLSNVVAVAAGYSHSLALKSDGTVVGWGSATAGITTMPTGITNVASIAAGASFNVAITPAPYIYLQPVSAVFSAGTNVTFTVGAMGPGILNYQWRFEGADLPDETRSALMVTNVQQQNVGGYTVLISNTSGSILSQPAYISGPPTIVSAPQDQAVLLGSNVTFSGVVASTAPATYQWRFKGANISGATALSHTINNAQTNAAGDYRIVASNYSGSVTSAIANLSVNVPASIVSVSSNLDVVAGTSPTVSVITAGTSPLFYQWKFNNIDIAGATTNPLPLTAIQSNQAGAYSVVVTNYYGTATSSNIVVAVRTPPTIVSQPAAATVLQGSDVTFAVTATGTAPLFYQWKFKGFFNNITGATNTSFQLTNVQPSYAGSYSVQVSNSAGSVFSSVGILTVLAPPLITSQPQGMTALAGTNVTLQVSATGTAPLTFRWYQNNALIATTATGGLTFNDVQLTNAGTYYVSVSNQFGIVVSSNAVLNVSDRSPVILSQPVSTVVWNNDSVQLSVTAAGSEPISYQWYFNGTAIPASTNATLTFDSIQPSASGRYQVVVTNGFGAVTSDSATITVLAVPSPGTVVRWGNSAVGDNTVPYDVCSVVSIAAGGGHSLALQSDGTVRAWGDNGFGQISVPAGLGNVVQVAAGRFFSLALQRNGLIQGWGSSGSSEITAPAGLKDVIAIAAGANHSVALKNDGTVFAWGLNYSGQTIVPAGLSNVVAISAGSSHTMALKSDGTVVVWGLNSSGQTNTPVGLSGIKAIAGGYSFCLALRSNGTVVAWGDNSYGQCNVPAGLSGVVRIAAGGWYSSGQGHCIALKADGTIVCWGANDYGQLNFPVGLSQVTAISAGGTHSLALSNGLVTIQVASPPASVTTNAGADVTFSVTTTGTPLRYQWLFNGTNVQGATLSTLGLQNVQSANAGNYSVVVDSCGGSVQSNPAQLTVLPSVPQITTPVRAKTRHAGETVYLKVAARGTLPIAYQWQVNGNSIPGATSSVLGLTNLTVGDSGNYSVIVSNSEGTATSSANLTVLPAWPMGTPILWGSAAPPSAGFSGVIGVAAGGQFTVALLNNRKVLSWGLNDKGQTNVPATLNSNVLAIAAGEYHALAVKFDGTVVGWGYNYNGQATPPVGLTDVEAVATGNSFSTALKDDGTVVAWGNGYNGATTVPLGLSNVVAIAAGFDFGLALRRDGTVSGWGNNTYGQISGPAALSNVVAVAAGHENSIVLRSDGTVKVFGPNFSGENTVPAAATNVIAVATVYRRCAVLRADRTVLCWGFDDVGQSTSPSGLSNVVALSIGDVRSSPPASGSHSVALKENGVFITAQPAAVTAQAGTTVNFSVQASGVSPLTYQWCLEGAPVLGATNTILSLTNIQPQVDGNYTVVISSSVGSCTSAPAKLTVLFAPKIVIQPQSQTVLAGTNVSFSVGATGTAPVFYQWQTNNVSVSGATGTNFTLLNVRFQNPVTVRVIVSNSYGSTTSSNAVLTVNIPPSIVSQPTNQMAIVSSNVTFATVATGTGPLAYQWSFNGTNLFAATNSSLILPSIRFSDAGTYRVQVTNSFGVATSAAAVLSVLPTTPTILTQPTNVAVPVGSTTSFAVAAAGSPPLFYQWFVNNTPIPNATNAVLSITNAQKSMEGEYRATIDNAFGTATSQPATLVVNPRPNVVVWGINDNGQTNVPADLTNAVAIATGSSHVLAIRSDGTVKAWGLNNLLQATVPPGLSNVIGIAAGSVCSLALKADGTVVGWGSNYLGAATPPAGLSNVIAIAGGDYHTLALKNDGTVVGWGYNAYGQASPPTGLSNVVAIAAGFEHSLALKSDGTVVAWGYYYGDPSSLTNITAISGKSFHFLALRNDGRVIGWPGGAYEGPTNAMNITSGWYPYNSSPHNLAILSNRTVAAWGLNTSGQANPPATLSNVVAISAGNAFSVALVRVPQILTQPLSQSRVIGENVTFSVDTYSENSVTYQWRFSGTNLIGETNSTLSIENLVASQAGVYSVVVSNNYGTVTSADAILSLAPVYPLISKQPQSQTVIAGTTAKFSASVTGASNLVYQWYLNGGAVSGATTASLVISNVQPIHAGNYLLFATNTYGVATSAPATLSVVYSLTVVPTDGGNVVPLATNAAPGTTVTLVANSQSGYVFARWTGDVAETNNPLNIVMDTNKTVSAIFIGNGDVIIDNTNAVAVGAWNTSSSGVTKFRSNYQFKTQGSGAASMLFSPKLIYGGSYAVYEWHPTLASLSTAATYWVTHDDGITPVCVNQATNGGQWNYIGTWTFSTGGSAHVVIDDAIPDGTKTVAADAIRFVLVPSAPRILSQPSSKTVLAGAPVQFSIDVTGTSPFTYQWRRNGENLIGETSSSLSISSTSPTDAGSYTASITNAAGAVVSSPATLTVIVPQLTISLNSADLRVQWTGALILQTATNLAGPFEDIQTFGNIYTNFDGAERRFFRLRSP